MTMKPLLLLMRQKAKEYPSFPLGIRLYIRLGLYSRGKTFHTPGEEKEDCSACMLRKAEQTLLPYGEDNTKLKSSANSTGWNCHQFE